MPNFSLGVGMFHQWLAPLNKDETSSFLKTLKQKNVDFAELKLTCSKWDKRIIQIREILKAGLDVTIHAGFEGDYNIALFRPNPANITLQKYSAIFEKCHQIALEKGSMCIVNFHGAAQTDEITDIKILMKRSIDFVKWAFKEIKQKKLQIKLIVEIMPWSNSIKRIGVYPEDLLELQKEAITSSRGLDLGFCWDLGHYQKSLNEGLDIKPNPEFTENVTHVHLHDVCGGADHLPLKFKGVDWKYYISLLAKNKKDIRVVLELDYKLTSNLGCAYDLLYESIEKATHQVEAVQWCQAPKRITHDIV